MIISNFKRLFILFEGYERWFYLSLLLNIAVAAGTLAIPALSAGLIDEGIGQGDFNTTLDIGILMLLAAIFAGICQVCNAGIAVWASEYSSHTLRERTFRKIQTLSFGDIDRFRSSDLLVRLSTDIQNIKVAVQESVMNLMQAPLLLIGTIIITSFMGPGLVFIMILLLILLAIPLIIYFICVGPAFRKKHEKVDGVNKALRETLSGIRVVKAFVRQKFEVDKFCNAADELRISALRPQYIMAYLMPAVFAISILGFGAVYYFGGSLVLEGTGLHIGEVTSAAQYILILMMPLLIIAIVLPFITQASSSLSRIYEVLDAIPEVRNPEHPVRIVPEEIRGKVVFEDVSFAYRNSLGEPEGEVLSGINVTAEPGETIGFLGATGSGKSSLISLIPRFYDVSGGKVLIDGIDVRSFSLGDLRRIVGVCLQEPILFSGLIRDSIRFGRDDLTDDEIIEASRAADADGFIQNIPEGYEARVARRGANFSGGQRQRMAIARTLAKKPKILILDDSTSACDVSTEASIQDAISRTMGGSTKFIVAQRISSVITADRIILLDQGKIIASGTHAELLADSAMYREIYESQLGSGLRSSDPVKPGGES